MTKEEKKLLLIDLCGRLLFGVICNSKPYRNILFNTSYILHIEEYEIKPYLRPMSSMTEVERQIYETMSRGYTVIQQATFFDWLNEHHFDYRGLIDKGLALEAPSDMYNETK